MPEAKKSKTIFEHLSGIKEKKVSWESLSDMDKKSFSPFIVNRWLSMNLELVGLVNELQPYTIGMLSPRDTYKLYLDVLPKKKTYDKYVKSKTKGKYNDSVLEYLSKYFEVSHREVKDYLEILPKDEVIEIISKFGVDKKEIKKWLK